MPKKVVGKIYYTRKQQPYKILPNGKARFVSKASVGKKKKKAPKAAVGGSARVGGALRRPWQKL